MGRFSKLFPTRKKHQARKENSSASGPTSNNAITTGPPPKQTSQPTLSNQPTQSSTLTLWQTAYEQLDKRERNILSTKQFPADPNDKENHFQLDTLIGEVIRLTEEQYEKYQQKKGKLRESSQKIINAALSFKDIIGAVAAADPTQHAATAWTIVSLGLTIAKNHSDLRDALFKSSEFLADILTQCTFIETKFYINCHFSIKDDLGKAIVRLYKAILHYTAQVRDAQDPGMGKNLLNWVTAITEHPLTELKASVNKERDNISQWIGLVEHLHHKEDAENILRQIDKLADSMKHLTEQFSLANLRVAEGAFYDSYINEHQDFCLPETRTELRSQISKWAESSDSKCLFWLNGMAGTGKSTIARTIAQSFKDKGQLGATFFFKRGEADRGNMKYLISTITRQLVTKYRQLVPDVLDAIKNDPNIASKFVSDQFDKLLYQPLLKLRLNQPTRIVIVIDALDECEREDDIRVILQLLFRLQEIKSVHLRVFLTSRPELSIRLGFKQKQNHQGLVLHELPKPEIERDIRLYLVQKLSTIRDERSLPSDWPGEEEVESLVKVAVPLFIFAATACRFIKEGMHPKQRLQKLLDFQATTSASQMGKMYLPVLDQLIKNEEDDPTGILKEFQDIVGVIILLATPLSVKSLSRLLQLPAEDIGEVLDPLHSVLSIPDNREAPVRILHLSFRDYLLVTESRFRVNEKETHGKIVSHSLRVMDNILKHNICDLPSYGIQQKDINSQDVNRCLSAELQYSCSYWVYHLHQSQACIPGFKVFSFLKRHFLHWLEALSLMGVISEAVGMIDMLQAAVGVERTWSPQMQTLEGHSAAVTSVAFSGNGQTLASGSDDHTIKLWDTKTGAELQTLIGHSGYVRSVAFSGNGQMLASGSRDCTIKLWDTKTGAELQTLTGHSGYVWSVAFSGDGQMLASGSYDHTIKLWDTKTGAELKPATNTLYAEGDTSMKSSSIPQLHDPTSSNISTQISVSDNWVALRGQKVLWLPPEHRRFCCAAFKDATVALGYSDGRVSILRFNILYSVD
ncbi:hypothetical protein CNMCM5623_002126 [Aspergillus felis]|uniref:NACHT domain-containing protein n=1 Tax=Aspergillus felis TaxID=1287682 RepID=A0A8H6UW83_9EURO|nr:hypothetical protein CNMCM5623_002126 [Aspergillus felis]